MALSKNESFSGDVKWKPSKEEVEPKDDMSEYVPGQTKDSSARGLTREELDRLGSERTLVSDFKQMKLEREAQKNWDLFYKRNTTNFFKDRHWTTREFEELKACREVRSITLITFCGYLYETLLICKIMRVIHYQSTIQLPTFPTTTVVVECSCDKLIFVAIPSVFVPADVQFESQRLVLLEAGCGVGNCIFPLLEADLNIFVYACDFSPRAVEFVKVRYLSIKYISNILSVCVKHLFQDWFRVKAKCVASQQISSQQ